MRHLVKCISKNQGSLPLHFLLAWTVPVIVCDVFRIQFLASQQLHSFALFAVFVQGFFQVGCVKVISQSYNNASPPHLACLFLTHFISVLSTKPNFFLYSSQCRLPKPMGIYLMVPLYEQKCLSILRRICESAEASANGR